MVSTRSQSQKAAAGPATRTRAKTQTSSLNVTTKTNTQGVKTVRKSKVKKPTGVVKKGPAVRRVQAVAVPAAPAPVPAQANAIVTADASVQTTPGTTIDASVQVTPASTIDAATETGHVGTAEASVQADLLHNVDRRLQDALREIEELKFVQTQVLSKFKILAENAVHEGDKAWLAVKAIVLRHDDLKQLNWTLMSLDEMAVLSMKERMLEAEKEEARQKEFKKNVKEFFLEKEQW